MIFYDQRGTGRTQLKSRTRPEDITFAALMEDLQNTILWIKQTYKVDKIILLGLSWGSVLGTQYALLHPEDLLCYIGTGQLVSLKDGEKAGFDHTLEVIGTPDEEDKRILKQLGDYPYSIDPDHFLDTISQFRRLQRKYHTAFDPTGIKQIIKQSGTFTFHDIPGMLNMNMKHNEGLFRYLLDYDVSGQTDYKIPVYYILGKDDWQVPSILASAYLERITAPDKKCFMIEHAGHIPNIDNPDAFREALREIVYSIQR